MRLHGILGVWQVDGPSPAGRQGGRNSNSARYDEFSAILVKERPAAVVNTASELGLR